MVTLGVGLIRIRSLGKLDGIGGIKMPLGEDEASQGQAFNASLVNVQEKKVLEHQRESK
jgi:hypothetical protein